jgi:hypothetical protein
MSRESRGARDVLAEIRRVIFDLEQKDYVLNEELKTWKSMSGGSDTEKIQDLVEENANLKKQVKQNSDFYGEKMQEMKRLKDENAHLQGSISAKDAEINKLTNDLNAQKHTCVQMSNHYVKMESDLKRSQADLLGTRGQMNSYSSAWDNVTKENNDLKTENVQLKETIRQLQTAAASSDQTKLEKDYSDLLKEVENVRAESKRNKETSDHNYTLADQYRTLYEKTKKEKEIIQEEIAKLRSGGVAAPVSQSLVSPDPTPIAARVDVQNPKVPPQYPIAFPNTDISQKNDESQPAAQEGGGLGAIIGSTVRGLKSTVSYLRGSRGGVDSTSTPDGRGGADSRPADSGSDDSSDDEDNTAAGSPSREPERGAGSDKVIPPYAVTAEFKDDKNGDKPAPAAPAAAASSNNTVGGQPAAGKAQEDYSDILNIDILKDKAKILKFFGKMGLKMPDNRNYAAIVYVQMILESEQYKPRLLKTARYYNINTTIPDDKKIEQIWKFFSEFERLKNATKGDFDSVCTEMNLSKDRDNLIESFHQIKTKDRAKFSYQLFNKLTKDKGKPSVESLYHQAGFPGKLNKDPMILALIEDMS